MANTSNMKNENVLVYEAKGYIDHITAVHNETLKQLRAINDDYKKLGLAPLTTENLKSLFHHLDDFIKKETLALIGEIPSFGGYKMKAEAFLQTLELPDTSSIKEKIRALNEYWKRSNANAFVLDSFSVVNGDVSINEDSLNAKLDIHRIFAKNQKEQQVFQAFANVLKAYQELDNVVKENRRGSGGLSNWKPEIYLRKDDNGNTVINEQFYLVVIGESDY